MRMRSATARVPRLQCLALLTLCGAAAAPVGADPTPAVPAPLSSIRVTGDARVSARPDRVQIDLGVQTVAPLSRDAASGNARTLDAVLAAVKAAAGPTGQLRTVSYSLSPNAQYLAGGG